MSVDLDSLTLAGASEGLRAGDLSSGELTRACLTRIEATANLNAFLTVAADQALGQAAESDRRLAAKEHRSPLEGIPISLKDILLTRDMPTTCASRILEGFHPPYDATVVARLRAAGAVFLGKTNLDEFAMGSSNENSSRGPARNPWDPDRVPGGSSGGSAVSVAARQCLGSIGTDTGGSIRQPAAFCGVVGVKPTYGRVSRYGVIAFASSLDQVGPVAQDVRDAALLLETIAGVDPRDSTSVDREVPRYTKRLGEDIRGLRIGIPEEFFAQGLQPDVDRAVRKAIEVLEGLGATVSPVSLPHTRHAVATYYLVATAEASSNLARYDGMRYGYRTEGTHDLLTTYARTRDEGFGEEVKRRILLGTFALSAGYYDAYYGKAQRVRTLIRRDFDEAFRSVDVLAAPTTPTTAFRLGEKVDDPLTMYVSDVLTISANLAGLPALSIPCGADSANLPVGLQLLGPPFAEGDLLRSAFAYEQATDWHRRRPATAS